MRSKPLFSVAIDVDPHFGQRTWLVGVEGRGQGVDGKGFKIPFSISFFFNGYPQCTQTSDSVEIFLPHAGHGIIG